MPEAIYILCVVVSLGCAVLLFRNWGATRARLLLWSGICFIGLCLNNVLLFLDLVTVPEVDLSPWRALVALITLAVFIFGLIFDAG